MAMQTDTTTLKLEYPIKLQNGAINEITISNRVKGKHMRAASTASTEFGMAMAMLPGLTGLEQDIIDELDEVDVKAAFEVIKKNRKQGKLTSKTLAISSQT